MGYNLASAHRRVRSLPNCPPKGECANGEDSEPLGTHLPSWLYPGCVSGLGERAVGIDACLGEHRRMPPGTVLDKAAVPGGRICEMGRETVHRLSVARRTGTVLSGAVGHSGNGQRLTRRRTLAASWGRDWPVAHRDEPFTMGKL